jgi:hypothetical protein
MNNILKLLLIPVLILASSVTLADHRDYNRGNNWSRSNHDIGFNRGRVDRGRIDSWSVGISIGSAPLYRDRYGYSQYNSPGYPFVFNPSLGFINRSSLPYTRGWRQERPVIINNTYINSTPTRRVIESTVVPSGTSLLRDRYGRCYERETDGFGNETRRELPATRCDF